MSEIAPIKPATRTERYKGHVIKLVYVPDSGEWQFKFSHTRKIPMHGTASKAHLALAKAKRLIDELVNGHS